MRGSGRRGCEQASSGATSRWASPTKSTVPSRRWRSITIRTWSPSRSLPIGPPARASGPDMSDARAGAHAGETSIGDHGDLVSPRQVAQGGGDLVDLLHSGTRRGHGRSGRARRPAEWGRSPCPLIAAMASVSRQKTRAGPVLRYTPSESTTRGSIAVLLITEPSGREVAAGEADGAGDAEFPARCGREDHVVRIDAIARREAVGGGPRGGAISPTTPAHRRAYSPATVRTLRSSRSMSRRRSITSGTPPAR